MATDPINVQYQTTAPGVPGRIDPVPGVRGNNIPRPAPQTERIQREADRIAREVAYRPAVFDLAGYGENVPMTSQHDPRAPWVAAYPNSPESGGILLTEPTNALTFVNPGNPGLPRAPDPRPSITGPVPNVPAEFRGR